MPTFPQFSPSFDPAAARQLGDEVLQLLVDAEEERFEGLEALFVPRHQARGRPAEMDGIVSHGFMRGSRSEEPQKGTPQIPVYISIINPAPNEVIFHCFNFRVVPSTLYLFC